MNPQHPLSLLPILTSLHPSPITAIRTIARDGDALRVQFRSDSRIYDAVLRPDALDTEEQVEIRLTNPESLIDRTDEGIRLCDLDRMGSRYKFSGRLFVPNQPYRQGDRFVVLAAKNGFVRKVVFSPADADPRFTTKDPYSPTYWANLYFSFASPDPADGSDGEEDDWEEAEDVGDEGRSDEAIEVDGELLSDDAFDGIAEVSEEDVLAVIEGIVGGDQ